MKYYIAIDGGTTNTRVSLVGDGEVLDTVRLSLGARAGMDGTEPLKKAIREAIATLLSSHSLTESDIVRILASGMITSEFGLCNLPHLQAPAGIAELHAAMHETRLEEISPIPFVFLRGVRYDGEDLLDADMMRGEETELMGLLTDFPTASLYVLPGSHSKLIEVDEGGRIVAFATMLTGEMIASLSANTILRDAVDLKTEGYDPEALLMGYNCARNAGLNEALFKVRILKNRFAYSGQKTYSFFLGAILSSEIDTIRKNKMPSAVIAGRAQIKDATVALLEELSDKTTVTVPDALADTASARGAVRIYEYGGASK